VGLGKAPLSRDLRLTIVAQFAFKLSIQSRPRRVDLPVQATRLADALSLTKG
jgi:hypothetical protein